MVTSSQTSSPEDFQTMENLLRNPQGSDIPWIIQKYGGTSVGKFLDNICGIAESYIPENKVAIVCSARSGSTKALGTTNLLLQASREALRPAQTQTDSNGFIIPASGTATPLFPKRVGSGFFEGDSVNGTGSGSGILPSRKQKSSSGVEGGNMGMSSSISSLRDLRLNNGRMERSPSPFQSSVSVASCSSQRTPTGEGLNGNSAYSVPPSPGPFEYSSSNGNQTQSLSNPPPSFHRTVDILKNDHLLAARRAVKDRELLDELEDEIERDCEGLRSFLSAAQIIDEISPRSQDSIVGIGEKLACKIVAAALRDRGIDSELVVLDNIVDASFAALDDPSSTGDQGASTLPQTFYDSLSTRLGERILACGNRVPVITGYFGVVPGSLLAQIGRGYTDLCAALCAVGVRAAELQVWKEVDGIFTADPRKVPTARLVPIITPDEAAELTYYGSEVIHPFTMEQVIRARIPIRIKNVENAAGQGTIIYPKPSEEGSPMSSDDEAKDSTSRRPRISSATVKKPASARTTKTKLPTAVTIKDHIMVLNIHSNRKTISHGFLARIFGTLDRAGVVVDLISTSEVHVSMAMQDAMSKKSLDRLLRDLEKIGSITVSRNMAILSLVGRQMRHEVGIAGKMFSTLAEGKINIEMISQGASEINISCVIEEQDSVKALNLIHQACLTAPAAASLIGNW